MFIAHLRVPICLIVLQPAKSQKTAVVQKRKKQPRPSLCGGRFSGRSASILLRRINLFRVRRGRFGKPTYVGVKITEFEKKRRYSKKLILLQAYFVSLRDPPCNFVI